MALGVALVVVTGKGGVGKSTVAAALALDAARAGLRVALLTVDRGVDRHPLLGVPLAPTAVRCAGFDVIRVDPFDAMHEYIRRNYAFPGVFGRLVDSGPFRAFAAAAPGFEDLMTLGKVYDLATHGRFDRVVLDAPSTGHVRTLLDVPNVTLRAIRGGPLSANALKIRELLLDRARTAVVPVTLAEPMPVAEALELETYCRDHLRMRVAPLVVNGVVPERLADAEVAWLGRALGADPAAAALLAAVHGSAAAAGAQRAALAALAGSRLAQVTVPWLADVADVAGVADEAVSGVAVSDDAGRDRPGDAHLARIAPVAAHLAPLAQALR